MYRFSKSGIVTITLASMLLAAAGAAAQVEVVARVADDDDEFGERSTDAAVSVGEDAILVTTNHGLTLLDRTGYIIDEVKMTDTGFPFIRTGDGTGDVAPSRWFDGRTEYDPENNRQWILYSEENASNCSAGDDDISSMHLAVSKGMTHPNEMDGFGNDDWWFYTGTTSDPGNGDIAFDMNNNDIERFVAGGPHRPFPDTPFAAKRSALFDLPTMAIEDDFVFVTAFGIDADEDPMDPMKLGPAYLFQAMFIIPIEFGSGSSMLDGDKPAEDLIVCMRPRDLPEADDAYERDLHTRHFAVQEPFEQEDNAQFFISLDRSAGEKSKIRLGGLWFDPSDPPGEWRYTQHLDSGTLDLADMAVPTGMGLEFFATATGGYDIVTPDSGFSPSTGTSFFSSAVLAEDVNGDMRMFAAHHVYTEDSSGDVDGIHVQWYYIDPDLDDFRKVQDPVTWTPSILESGRISTDGTNAGDCYFPSIGVTKQGVAYVEYTFSNGTTWPEIRRVQLDNDYDTAIHSNFPVKAGPENLSYKLVVDECSPGNQTWADFSDMQADPFTCDLWSSHTLVHDDMQTHTSIDEIDLRDVWLLQNPINCNNANLNGDGGVDLLDMAMFNDYYATGARRVDMNTDGTTDATDAAEYADAYGDQKD
ncbi:MAG: hypothetical protein NCW75_07120 [Phycisphaera sp.]|nr:MAG: hypothetical protein NCW75_07120 [Phycisphaera sp.]